MQYYRTIEQAFEVDSNAELVVENRRGEIVVVAEDRSDITFTGQLSVAAEGEREGQERLDAIQLPIASTRSHVSIGPPSYDEQTALTIFGISLHVPRASTRVDMQLRVPRTIRLVARARSGPVRITGLATRVDVTCRSGRVELAQLDGGARVDNRSGSVEVRDTRGDLDIGTRSGKTEVERVDGDVTVRGRSGSTSLLKIRGDVKVESRSGRLRFEEVEGRVEASNGSGSVEFRGRVANPITVDLHSGSVRLAVTRDSAFWMDAETRSGSIRSELPVDYLKEPGEDAPTVRVRTGSGSIRVVTAAVGLLALPTVLALAQALVMRSGLL